MAVEQWRQHGKAAHVYADSSPAPLIPRMEYEVHISSLKHS